MDPKFFRRYADLIAEAEQRLGVEVTGLQGKKPFQKPFKKSFTTQAAYEEWKLANEKHGDVEITSTRVLDTTPQAAEKPQEPDNRETFQLFHAKGPYTGQPLNMTKDKALRYVKNQVMQKELRHWAALVDSDGTVIWTWDPNGFLPDRFNKGYDTKPLPAEYAAYGASVEDLPEGQEPDKKHSKTQAWKAQVLAKYPNAEIKDPRRFIPKDGSYHLVAIVKDKVVDEIKGNLFRDRD